MSVSELTWLAVLARYGWRCYYCGWDCQDDLTRDHYDPQGPDTAVNLVPACRWCNSQKGDRHGNDYWRWRRLFPSLATFGPHYGWELASR